MSVPFVVCLTTNLDHTLPFTSVEFNEFCNAKDNLEHFKLNGCLLKKITNSRVLCS